MDKKRHGHHFTDEPDESGKFKRLEKRRVQEQEDLGLMTKTTLSSKK